MRWGELSAVGPLRLLDAVHRNVVLPWAAPDRRSLSRPARPG
jgi:hypothetical protein